MKFIERIKKSKAFQAGIGYIIGNYLLKGISFLTLPIFSRLMSVEEFGLYNVYLGYNEILTILIGLALHSSLKNAKYKYHEKLDSYLSCILILPIISLVCFLLFGNAFSKQLCGILKVDNLILNLLILHSFGSAILIIYNAKLSLNYQFKNYIILSSINSIFNIGISLILMLTLLANDKYLARIIGTAVPLIVLSIYILITSFVKSHPKANKEYILYSLRYSLPVVPHGISQVVLSSSDKIMIERYIGETESGLYSMGTSISGIIRVTTSSLDTVYGPWFYEKAKQENYKQIKKVSSFYILFMLLFLSIIMLLAPEIVLIMGGEAYSKSIDAVIPCIASMFFTFLYTLPSTVEYFYEKTWIVAVSSVFAAIMNVILNLLFIPKYGYSAAAYTTLFSYMVYFLIHLIASYIISKRCFFNLYVIFFSIFFIFMIMLFSLYFSDKIMYRILLFIVLLFSLMIGLAYFVFKKRRQKNE